MSVPDAAFRSTLPGAEISVCAVSLSTRVDVSRALQPGELSTMFEKSDTSTAVRVCDGVDEFDQLETLAPPRLREGLSAGGLLVPQPWSDRIVTRLPGLREHVTDRDT